MASLRMMLEMKRLLLLLILLAAMSIFSSCGETTIPEPQEEQEELEAVEESEDNAVDSKSSLSSQAGYDQISDIPDIKNGGTIKTGYNYINSGNVYDFARNLYKECSVFETVTLSESLEPLGEKTFHINVSSYDDVEAFVSASSLFLQYANTSPELESYSNLNVSSYSGPSGIVSISLDKSGDEATTILLAADDVQEVYYSDPWFKSVDKMLALDQRMDNLRAEIGV